MSFEYHAHKFANGGVLLKAYGTGTSQELSLDQIRQEVPSIFALGKHESRSEKFTFIPTGAVLEAILKQGWVATEVRQGGSRIEGKADYTKHSVRLRQQGHSPREVGVGDTIYPEIILSNAHDGTSAYILGSGAFRPVCTNGLVCSSAFSQVRIPHKGDVIDNVIEGVFEVVRDLPKVVDTANAWAAKQLNPRQQEAFAKASLQLRWQPEEAADGQFVETAPIDFEQVNRARRHADVGSDIWHTYNRVQEGLLRGGQHYVQRDPATQRRIANRKVREVNGVEGNRALNQALWTLTEALAEQV